MLASVEGRWPMIKISTSIRVQTKTGGNEDWSEVTNKMESERLSS